jgi:hypothetical protein
VKPRLLATVICLGVPVGLFWLWVTHPSFTESTSKKSSLGSAKPGLVGASATPAATEPPEISDRADPQKLFEAVEATNVPINLWGRVIDEDARPVGGVVIDYDYSIEHGNLQGVAWSDQEVRAGQAITDQGGLFSVRGLHGHILEILAVKHPDYQYRSKGAVGFDFYGNTASGKFVPDQHRPVAFTMVHKKSLEPLSHFEGTLHVPGDASPQRWNLWQGESDPKGELMVTLRREPAVLQRPGQAAIWSAELRIVGGGITEAPWDEDVRRAPETGYLESVLYPDREQRQGVPFRSFYIKSADGRFGRLQIELDARGEGSTAPCYITVDMNPRPGSRNLEPTEDE